MQIMLNTYGTFLGVSDGCFSIRQDGGPETVSPRYVTSILLVKGTCK